MVRYLIYQQERGESSEGRIHIQGYVELLEKKGVTFVKQAILRHPTAHLERKRGSRDQARDYCRKEAGRVLGPFEFGNWVEGEYGSDRVTALGECVAAIRRGATDREILDGWPEVAARHWRTLLDIRQSVETERLLADAVNDFNIHHEQLRPWQRNVVDELAEQNDRQVLWIYDPVGGHGKSYLAWWMIAQGYALDPREEVLLVTTGKHSDIAYSLAQTTPSPKLVIFDLPRQQSDKVPYGVMEQMKNGVIFVGKYQSRTLRMRSLKILVFSNFKPDIEDNFTRDRYENSYYMLHDNQLSQV